MFGTGERVIDSFTHFLPPDYADLLLKLDSARQLAPLVERFRRIQTLCDVDARLKLVDPWPSLQQVLSLALPTPELVSDASESVALARLGNDRLAEIVTNNGARFPAFLASLPMNDVDASLQEMERAVSELGARGLQILTSVAGKPLDHPTFFPVFEKASRMKVPIFLHPFKTELAADYPTESRSEFEITNVLGWPHETSVAMARIVFSEMFIKLPDIKIVAHHLGGTVPYLAGRVGPMWDQLGLRSGNSKHAEIRARLGEPPQQQFRRFYADSAVADTHALQCGLGFFGTDNVLFASDAPFGPEGGTIFIRANLDALNEVKIPGDDARKIASGNARRLLRL